MLSLAPTLQDGETRVWMAGVCLDALSERQLIDQVIASTAVGRGGWIATPNMNFLRQVESDLDLQELLSHATLRVADGMPLLWASRLARTPRLERVPGSELLFSLTLAAAHHNRSIYLIGGRDGASVEASRRLKKLAPGLRVVGAEGPWMSADVTDEEIEPIIQRLEAARPDIVFVGLGFPKQERFIAACRDRLPSAWFLGCGAAVNFAAGYESRAPRWMQRSGLEWIHRLLAEPRRLAVRYAGDLPFALRVLAVSTMSGVIRGRVLADAGKASKDVVVLPEIEPATETTRPVPAVVRTSEPSPAAEIPIQADAPEVIDLTALETPVATPDVVIDLRAAEATIRTDSV